MNEEMKEHRTPIKETEEELRKQLNNSIIEIIDLKQYIQELQAEKQMLLAHEEHLDKAIEDLQSGEQIKKYLEQIMELQAEVCDLQADVCALREKEHDIANLELVLTIKTLAKMLTKEAK